MVKSRQRRRIRKRLAKGPPADTLQPRLPNDVLLEILYRLPLKPLTRFKLTCWEWYSLISNPDFMRDRNIRRRVAGDQLITIREDCITRPFRAYAIQCRNPEEEVPLYSPLEGTSTIPWDMKILGSCNGLVVMLVNRSYFILWNPTTQSVSNCYPQSIVPWHKIDLDAVGLLHNNSRNEYIAVLIGMRTIARSINPISVIGQFANLNTGCVTSVSGTNRPILKEIEFSNNRLGAIVCGVPHWVVNSIKIENSGEQKQIVYFDSENEFRQMTLPNVQEKTIVGLGALYGQTQLGVVLHSTDVFDLSYDVWVMKEYGKPESWTNLCNISSLSVTSSPRLNFIKLLGFTPTGELLMQHEKLKLLAHDLGKLRSKDIDVPSFWRDNGEDAIMISYEPSVTSPPHSRQECIQECIAMIKQFNIVHSKEQWKEHNVKSSVRPFHGKKPPKATPLIHRHCR